MTEEYIRRLTSAFPAITEVWLLGSRANSRARVDSDYDYLVFSTDDSILNQLCQTPAFRDPAVDLLFAGTGDMAISPWPEPNGSWKKLGLKDAPGGLAWRPVSASEAEYRETKPKHGGAWSVVTRTARAIRVYPDSQVKTSRADI